ncbi:MAG: RsmE family RNA methyltransferase [bacterium]
MNLLLLEPHELSDDDVSLTDRRADHILRVIQPDVGDTLRVGVIGGALGQATVQALEPTVRLAVQLDTDPPPPPRVQLVLAVPRPKVLRRVLQTIGALGVHRLDLVNAWRVEKSYFQSPLLAPDAIRHELIIGAEQGATTWLPAVAVHRRLMAYLDAPPSAGLRVVAHPGATQPLESVVPPGDAPCLVAVGPEGGWIQWEVDTFIERGFEPVHLGRAVLRTEQAVPVLLGQLELLLRLGQSEQPEQPEQG